MARHYESFGPVAQKVLLLLAAGIVLGLSTSPNSSFRFLKSIRDEWKRINNRALRRAIKNLYKSKLIDSWDGPDGTTTMVLTEKGKKKVLRYRIDEMTIAVMGHWDKKWRIVVFDIPEKIKKARDALAGVLKRLGFYQLQKSVFIFPHPCKEELNFVIEFFRLRPYVRYIEAIHLDNEPHLKEIFKL